MAMQPEHEAQLVAASIDGDPVVGPLVREMTKDVALQAGWKSLDVPALVQLQHPCEQRFCRPLPMVHQRSLRFIAYWSFTATVR
jgi:hypothetical protein